MSDNREQYQSGTEDSEDADVVELEDDARSMQADSNAPLRFDEIIDRLKSGQWVEQQRRSLRKRTLMIARQLHAFSSSLMLVLLLGFALTGWLLNHPEWLSGSGQQGAEQVNLSSAVKQRLSRLNDTGDIPLVPIQNELKRQFGLSDLKDFQWDREFSEVVLNYDVPAGYATVILDYENDHHRIEYRQGGFWSVMNDLHKGRHSGAAWSWLIDVSAWMMVFFAITGLLILWQNKKNKVIASWLLVAGIVAPLGIYWFWVPRLSGV